MLGLQVCVFVNLRSGLFGALNAGGNSMLPVHPVEYGGTCIYRFRVLAGANPSDRRLDLPWQYHMGEGRGLPLRRRHIETSQGAGAGRLGLSGYRITSVAAKLNHQR